MVGNSCSGKSTLGKRSATALQVPFVELDALNWRPCWVGLNETNPKELESLIAKATDGDGWVVAGSYMSFSQRVFWPRLETVVWLDLPIVPARLARTLAIVATLAVKGTALGHQL